MTKYDKTIQLFEGERNYPEIAPKSRKNLRSTTLRVHKDPTKAQPKTAKKTGKKMHEAPKSTHNSPSRHQKSAKKMKLKTKEMERTSRKVHKKT